MGGRRSWIRIAFALVLGVGLSGCAGRVLPPPPEPEEANLDDYVIGAADVLGVRVWKNPELSVDVPVRPDGRISVPLVNDVQAAGLTADELKQILTEALSEYITAPDVTVVVLQVNSKRIYVMGGVARPSAIALTQDLRVLDAIALAGGFNAFANKRQVKVLRKNGTEVVEYRFNFDAFVNGDAPEANLVLQPGDTVVVPD